MEEEKEVCHKFKLGIIKFAIISVAFLMVTLTLSYIFAVVPPWHPVWVLIFIGWAIGLLTYSVGIYFAIGTLLGFLMVWYFIGFAWVFDFMLFFATLPYVIIMICLTFMFVALGVFIGAMIKEFALVTYCEIKE